MLAKNVLTHPLNGSTHKSLLLKVCISLLKTCCKVLENNVGCCELWCPINERHDSQLPVHLLIIPSNQPGSIPSISIDSRYQIWNRMFQWFRRAVGGRVCSGHGVYLIIHFTSTCSNQPGDRLSKWLTPILLARVPGQCQQGGHLDYSLLPWGIFSAERACGRE